MATTFSLLAVFLPIGFMGGIVGRFMSSFGFTARSPSRSRCWCRSP
jgi:HAE1 family hydrophobic/amphiphilic exporter-1